MLTKLVVSVATVTSSPPHQASPSPIAHAISLPPPASLTQIDAAMTLLSAIQAKLVTKSSSASAWAPLNPSTARVATIDGTPSAGPIGASTAVNSAPTSAPQA